MNYDLHKTQKIPYTIFNTASNLLRAESCARPPRTPGPSKKHRGSSGLMRRFSHFAPMTWREEARCTGFGKSATVFALNS